MVLGELYAGVLRRTIWQRQSGRSVWEDDWDILCICDACRFDLMESVAPLYSWLPEPEDLQSINSVGTTSSEWISNTFSQSSADLENTVYISGNPYTHFAPEDQLKEVVDVSKSTWKETEVSTVPPKVLTDIALDYLENHDQGDRIIIHYMQPHTPFRSQPEWFTGEESVWSLLRREEISEDEFWEAYRDNLSWVIEEISRLRDCTDDQIVITSDHGNATGEYGLWAHPEQTRIPELVEVPWIKLTGIGAKPPEIKYKFDDWLTRQMANETEERLKAFGYLD
jgi:hypothetical protein